MTNYFTSHLFLHFYLLAVLSSQSSETKPRLASPRVKSTRWQDQEFLRVQSKRARKWTYILRERETRWVKLNWYWNNVRLHNHCFEYVYVYECSFVNNIWKINSFKSYKWPATLRQQRLLDPRPHSRGGLACAWSRSLSQCMSYWCLVSTHNIHSLTPNQRNLVI